MKLKQRTAYSLKRKLKSKEVVFFGAGKRLENTCRDFKECGFENIISYVVDNNTSLWETKKKVGKIEIIIRSPEYLKKHIKKNTVIVISTDKYMPVYEQLQGYDELKNTVIYKYPEIRYMCAGMWNWIFKIMPLKNTILFQGEGDSCENALALFEYLEEHDLLNIYKVVWLCAHPDKFQNTRNVKYINRISSLVDTNILKVWKYYYYRYTSRYLMYENRFIQKYREKQIGIYLKHGTFMIKNVKGKIVIPQNVNHAICTSENYADLAAEQESIDKEKLLICGSPRLDFLFKEKEVLKTLDIYKPEKKYIIWLPTMRQANFANMRVDSAHTYPFGIPLMKTDKEFTVLDDRLGKLNIKLIIKPHPRQNLSVYKLEEYKNIIFIPQTKLDEYNYTVHSLMRETDALISDYSSIAFDYMLLDKPIAYTIDDMEDYSIGFSVNDPLKYMPGEKLNTYSDMIKFIEAIGSGEDKYQNERRKIKDYIHHYQDDKNCERFLQLMKMI